MRKFFLIVVLTVFALTGCSKEEKNLDLKFSNALQSYLQSPQLTCFFISDFPKKTDPKELNIYQDKFKALRNKKYVWFKLKRRERIKNRGIHAKIFYHGNYYLTKAGKKLYQEKAIVTPDGTEMGCLMAGKAKFREIKSFTQPQEQDGRMVSYVTYTYSVGDLPDWAKEKSMVNAFPKLKAFVESTTTPFEDVALIVKTEQGWVHEAMVGKNIEPPQEEEPAKATQ